jgi:hypothetical protein
MALLHGPHDAATVEFHHVQIGRTGIERVEPIDPEQKSS